MNKADSVKFLGTAAKKVYRKPEIEHLLFHQCLLLSKSYEIAHRIKTKKIRKADQIPDDIDSVLKVYELVGNIYGKPFEIWWNKTGHNLFYDKRPIKKITLTLNLEKTTNELLTKASQLIKQAKNANKNASANGITFLVNKAHPISLFYRLYLVASKATELGKGKELPYWKLATEINFPSQRVVALNKGIKNVDEANKAREYISMLVCRKLSEAKFLTENAARGNFPMIASFSTALDFDYSVLPTIIHNQNIAEIEHMEEQRWADKPVLQWDYASELIRGINKQRKKNKRILAKAKKISENKNPIYRLN